MRKFLAVVKREYKKVVFSWAFLIGTMIAPLMAAIFAFVPMLIFSIKGETQRVALVDPTGKIAVRIKQNLSPERVNEKTNKAMEESLKNIDARSREQIENSTEQFGASFVFEDVQIKGKTIEQIRRELSARVQDKQIDSYLIIPENPEAPGAKFEYYSRSSGDFIVNSALKDTLNDAVRSQRLARSNISEDQLRELNREVDFKVGKLSESGEEKDSEDSGFGSAFVIGLLIYITLAIYGQTIMGAIVEEKETRIAEILFSSAKPFELMMGKLVGVGLAGLTQLSIWLSSTILMLVFGLASMQAAGIPLSMPNITPLSILYFLIFFLLGFFIFATIFALIGSMVTTVQEGSQFAFIPVLILLGGFYCIFPIIRDPNSTFSFWVSVAPFIAAVTMPVRIAIETPPLWQIALSILFNLAAIFGLVWLAARVYRVGMLMYGKRATLPEVWKWIWQN